MAFLSTKSFTHGVSYIFRKDSTRTEKWGVVNKQLIDKNFNYRIFRACSLSIFTTILFSLISTTLIKLLGHAIFVKTLENEISISEVPFPAVTICPDSLVFIKTCKYPKKSLSGNFTDDEWVSKYFRNIISNGIFSASQHFNCSIFFTSKTFHLRTVPLSRL